ncbi:MAG: PP2C family serine/threonine-protein phosphatase [Rubripirellula sp.]
MSDRWNSGIVFAELSDIGMRRANNQDSMASLPAKSAERYLSRGHLFVVADGMGAHAAGELASSIATEKIAMEYFRHPEMESIDALHNAVRDANDEIYQRGQSNPEFHNMGTTASSLALLPEGAVVAHVGDSRVYRLRDGVFEQLTFDHSLVWEMEASGHADSSAWGASIPKNVITRSLGPNPSVDIDVEGPFPIQKNDSFLLCSDGLTGLVEDPEIGALVDCLSEEQAVRVLVDLANLRGGPDNTSIIIVRVDDEPSQGGGKKRAVRSKESPLSPILMATTVFCFVIAAVLGVMQSFGPMIVAAILGAIAAGFTIAQMLQQNSASPADPPPARGGKGPYRRYDAKASKELVGRLGDTVQQLRDAAKENNWMMDWKVVDQHQAAGTAALKAGKPRDAIRSQSEAIIETMNQLREQNNRAANETAIDL